jgi:hypothetical protein
MSNLVRDASGTPAQFLQPTFDTETKYAAYTATAAATAVVPKDVDGKEERLCIITATTACWFLVGSDPTAVAGTSGAGSIFLTAGAYFYAKLRGGIDKVSFVRSAADGVGMVIPTK